MSEEKKLRGICLKVSPLGENDRLLTLLSDKEGISRLAVPGARKPRSRLAAASPLALIEIQVVGNRGLRKVTHVSVLHSFCNVGSSLDSLAIAQALAEVSIVLIGNENPVPGILDTLLIHLERLETHSKIKPIIPDIALAIGVQAIVHLIALGGYALPLQNCCRSGIVLEPPIGQWEWRCSLLPEEGFAIGEIKECKIHLNPSELALLQRLLGPNLPIRRNGELMGPRHVWLKLLGVIESWISTHLQKEICALKMLRQTSNV